MTETVKQSLNKPTHTMNKTTKTTAVATTKTTKTATKKTKTTAVANIEKVNKILTMTELIEHAHAHNVQFFATNNTSTQYRIFNGKSSIHIKKSFYRVYATTTDFELCKSKFDCIENGNITDGKRPHIVTVPIDRIDDFLTVISANKLNNAQ